VLRQGCPKNVHGMQQQHIFFLGTGIREVGREATCGNFRRRIGPPRPQYSANGMTLSGVLNQFHGEEIHNLLRRHTEIAKGRRHGVTLVGVVGATTPLGAPEFRDAETHVAMPIRRWLGATERRKPIGKVCYRTYHPTLACPVAPRQHDDRGLL